MSASSSLYIYILQNIIYEARLYIVRYTYTYILYIYILIYILCLLWLGLNNTPY